MVSAANDMIARLRLNAEAFSTENGRVWADFEERSKRAGSEIKTTIGSALAEVNAAAKTALTLPRLDDGALNLGTEALRKRADAARVEAVAMREVATAAERAANAERSATDETRAYAVASGSPAQELLAGSAMLPSKRGVGLWAPSDVPALSRYLRFTIGQGGSQPVTVGRLAAGKRIVLDRNFSFGAAMGVRDLGSADFSRRGVFLRSRGARLRTINLKFAAAHRDEVEAAILPLIEVSGNTEPFGLVLDPAPHAQRQRRIYFGVLVGSLEAIWARPGGFEWTANMVSLV